MTTIAPMMYRIEYTMASDDAEVGPRATGNMADRVPRLAGFSTISQTDCSHQDLIDRDATCRDW